MTTKTTVGIDLGTTNSCVAICRNGAVEIIPNEVGNRTTRSAVTFTESERLIGSSAFTQAGLNYKNLVYDAKRLIGRRFDDPEVRSDIQNFSFLVKEDKSMPVIEVDVRNSRRLFTPEEISGMVLQKMKTIAQTYLEEEVTDAVITVPAHFNDGQRQATKDAATIAGLNAIRIINEPTAAAVAYGLENALDGEKNVLVFDLGGGTFDVSIVNIKEGPVFEVKATTGDTHLGGSDFDQKLIQHFINEIKTNHSIDITTDLRAILRLKKACEEAKKKLSESQEALIEIDGLVDGFDFISKIKASEFEEMCSELFEKTLDTVKKALEDAHLHSWEIDDVVLVGGSTRIPKIQEMLKTFFGKDLKYSINPDEAVAYGAAVYATLLSSPTDLKTSVKDLCLLDVTPLSLGISVVGDLVSVLIPRNTRIPIKKTESYTTAEDDQTSVKVDVYEGERALIADNHKLGEFQLTEIPPAPRGTPSIDVTFEVNLDGILQVTALEKSTRNSKSVVIKNETGRLSEEEIERMVQEAKEFEIEDRKHRERVGKMNKLEAYAYKVRQSANKYHDHLSPEDTENAKSACEIVLEWIKQNYLAEQDQIDSRLEELKQTCEPIMVKLYVDN